jgi:hypothetical protein
MWWCLLYKRAALSPIRAGSVFIVPFVGLLMGYTLGRMFRDLPKTEEDLVTAGIGCAVMTGLVLMG